MIGVLQCSLMFLCRALVASYNLQLRCIYFKNELSLVSVCMHFLSRLTCSIIALVSRPKIVADGWNNISHTTTNNRIANINETLLTTKNNSPKMDDGAPNLLGKILID